MSHMTWKRHTEKENALDQILDAAGVVFAEVGVARATLIDIAKAAGCSRATLYRYYPNRDALHVAFVNRASLRIARMIADQRQSGTAMSLADRIVAGIAAVRADPVLAVWFEPENLAVPLAVSQNSEVLAAFHIALIEEADATDERRNDVEVRAAWLLRSVVSILAMPGRDLRSERTMIETCVVPVVAARPSPAEVRS